MIQTILVTDDSALDNAVMRNYLSNEHLNMISALNGREALDILESRNIDLIMLDMVMPVMDGMAFLNAFKQTPYYKTVPIIVASSLDHTDTIQKVLLDYEIFDYIIKPLDHINRLIVVNKIKAGLRYRQCLKELAQLKKD